MNEQAPVLDLFGKPLTVVNVLAVIEALLAAEDDDENEAPRE